MGAVGVVSNGAPTGTWGSGLARATHGDDKTSQPREAGYKNVPTARGGIKKSVLVLEVS